MALIRLGPRAAAKQRRLATLRAERSVDEAFLATCVGDARLLGSLELAGIRVSWSELRSGAAPVEAQRLRAAARVVPSDAPLDRTALRAWHGAVVGVPSAWRGEPRGRAGAAPVERIEGRLEILEAWLAGDSVARLKPAEAGSLVLSRIVEILPFDDGNGRVSRLAAGHAMLRAGGQAPILVGADAARLQECLRAAFALELEPLSTLLEEASERALDVEIQVLEGRVQG